MSNETLQHPRGSPPLHGSSDRIRSVTRSTFNLLVLKGAGPIAVEFMSYGCAYCRAIEPVLQRVAEMVQSKETIFRVNVAVEPELADAYAVRGTPTLIMFLNGTEAGRADGPPPTVSSLLAAVTQPFA
jgi:thioredoxin 1